MNIPGFNAQHSIYRSAANYRTTESSFETGGGGRLDDVIEPASACNLTKFQQCINNGGLPPDILEAVCNQQYGLCLRGASCCGIGEDRACRDVSSDPNNCGSCGHSCGSGVCCNETCCSAGNACSNGCCLVNPVGTLSSFNNYLLKNGCHNIEDLRVYLTATQALVAANGWSVQLNAYNPSGPTTSWMQYVITVSGSSMQASVQYWDMALFYPCASMTCMGSQTCINTSCVGPSIWLFNPSQPIPVPSTLPSNTLPAGWTLGIELTNDGSGNITLATFTLTDNAQPVPHTSTVKIPVPASFQFPIVAFQLNVVGPSGGAGTTFSPGAGSITYQADGQLCIEGGLRDACSNSAGSGTATAETSNVQYGQMSSCCGSSLTQSLTAP
jgi:hypothetical protein